MGLREKLAGFARVTATAAADALLDWADTPIQKADGAAPPTGGDKRNVSDDEGVENAPGGSEQESAATDPVPEQKATQEPKALFSDPFAIIEQLGYKEKPSAVTYNTLKLIMWRNPIVQAVVQTRVNQVAAFTKVTHDRYNLGFRVKLRESERQPTEQDKKWASGMETLLQRTGITDNPRGRPDFETFLRKLVWDSLVFDQACFEIVPNRRGEPAEWYAVDASTIRIADTARVYMNEDLSQAVRYVQIYDSMIVAEYTQEELGFGVRNPRTDIRLHGYGVSELEQLIHVITAFLNTWDYNAKFFTQGAAAKGLLNFKGAINETQLKAFRRHWYQMISGVENAWRTPITNAEDVQWLSMQSSNRDMEYNAWMDFLIKVTCSVYSMDPVEVNFKYGNTGQKGAMQESSNKDKITESKERGLRPLLNHMAALINRNIIWPLNESFEFCFMGLDSQTKQEAATLQTTQVKAYRTVDEIRAEEDLPPLPDGKGECILDPTWLQFSSSKDAAAQAAMNPMGMDPNGDPDFEAMLNGEVDENGNPLDENGMPVPLDTQGQPVGAAPKTPAPLPGQPFGGRPQLPAAPPNAGNRSNFAKPDAPAQSAPPAKGPDTAKAAQAAVPAKPAKPAVQKSMRRSLKFDYRF